MTAELRGWLRRFRREWLDRPSRRRRLAAILIIVGLGIGGDAALSVVLGPLYSLTQPGVQEFSTSVDSATYGNLSVYLIFITSNPAGLSAENVVTMDVRLSSTMNLTQVYGFNGIGVESPDAYPIYGNVPVSGYSTLVRLLPSAGANGYLWFGTEKLQFYSYGTLPIDIFFQEQNNTQFGTGTLLPTQPFVEVQSPIVTLEYLTDVLLLALEIVVVVLISYEVLRDARRYDEYRQQDTEP